MGMSQELLVTEEVLARLPPEAQSIIRMLLAKIAELEARLNKTPRNSSLPPSTEHPHAKPTPAKEKSGKKRGGQPGHPKYERALIPTERCQTVVECVPQICRRCGNALAGKDAEPLQHHAPDALRGGTRVSIFAGCLIPCDSSARLNAILIL